MSTTIVKIKTIADWTQHEQQTERYGYKLLYHITNIANLVKHFKVSLNDKKRHYSVIMFFNSLNNIGLHIMIKKKKFLIGPYISSNYITKIMGYP